MTDRLDDGVAEDRTMPAVTYALYFLTYATGITVIIGLILAYVQRDRAGARMRTHYTFLIRTFWIGIAWGLLAALLFAVGIPLSVVLIGLPLVFVAWAIWSLIAVWFAVRLVVGVIYLARDEAYPRPDTWLA
jgi:Predicted membrane protein